MFQLFKLFIWMTFQKLETCCNSKSSFLTLILWMENWLVSCVEEVFKSMKTVSSFYTTTIKAAMSTTTTHCSKPSDVLRVTQFLKDGNLERHLVTCSDRIKHINPKNVYELRETLFEKLDALKNPYGNEQKLFKNLAIFDFESICVKETLTSKLRLQNGSRSMSYFSFYLVKLDPGTRLSLQRQTSLSHLVFYHCSRRISNSKQSSDEIEFYWNRDCNKDKTVCYTGTTQPKTQASREGVKICRWLCRGGGWKGFIYTIVADAKESINWLLGTFWAVL